MSKKVTIQEIAKKAKVSRGTVDRVLNSRPHVSKEKQDRILRAIQELGYVPKDFELANSLGMSKKTNVIMPLGVVFSRRNEYYISEIKRGIRFAQSQLADYSIEVLIEETEEAVPDEIIDRVDKMVKKGVHGIALCAPNHVRIAQSVDRLKGMGIPVVTFGNDVKNCGRICFFGESLQRIGRVSGGLMHQFLSPDDAVIAVIGSCQIEEHQIKLTSFCQALQERGFNQDNIIIIETYNDYSVTYEKIHSLLLSKGGKIRGIYMPAHSINGCVDAVLASNLKSPVHIISNGLTRSSVSFLKHGLLDFCVTSDIYAEGYRPLMILQEYLINGNIPINHHIYSSTEIICKENLLA